MRKLPIYVGLLVALTVVVELLWHTPLQKGGEAPPTLVLTTVVDAASGEPLADATLTRLLADGSPLGDPQPVDRSGQLGLAVGSPRLVKVAAPSYDGRIVAVGPNTSPLVALSASDPDSVTVRIAGDVMMGRRMYEPGRDGSAAPLAGPTDQAGHDRLLAAVAPLLGDADLTVATLATPLVDDPYVSGPRPAGYHPDKPLLVSAPATARALAGAGVDVVNLATDHAFDALQPGLDSTAEALDDAGVAHFGAGATIEEAWTPAYLDVDGHEVAFLGCTTFAGVRRDLGLTADPTHGGAARCSEERIRTAVTTARQRAQEVVFLLQGAARTLATPEAQARRATVAELAAVAADAGAAVVSGGYQDGAGGVERLGDVPWLRATGDLVFDNREWEELPSSVARVTLQGGAAVGLVVDPLALVHQRPVPVADSLADAIARRFTSTDGTTVLGTGWAGWPGVGQRVVARLAPGDDDISGVGAGWTLDEAGADVSVGRDLLWGTGSMEDLDTDPDANGTTLWALGKYVTTSFEAHCGGVQGLRLRRGPLSAKDVVISPQYRQPVAAGTRLTLTAMVKQASEGASLEVRWYRTLDPTKRSSGAQSLAIVPHDLGRPCTPVRLDLEVPEGMVAVQPFVRLSPRHDVNFAAELRVDDVRLIAWSDPGAAGPELDTLEFKGAGEATVSKVSPSTE